ncbi:hypothetical protein ACFU53_15850 [Streptomyces sp. NPDC057474]|uniref:hypothetical protein n=1 Tax=Streptomyces sp. NPDC057474 TaxID=3346144 RepID=UPI00367509F5
MVTQQDIDEAEVAVEAAEVKLDQAEEHHHVSGGVRASNELKVAQAEANGARDRLRRLKALWAHQRAEEARRAAAEAGFPPKRREALTQQLADARDEAVHAVAAVEKSAAVALAAVTEYGVLVREASAELFHAGLRAGEDGQFGGATTGVVHLGGEVWRPADAGSLLAAVVRSAVAAQDARHPAAQWRPLAGLADQAAQAELLARAAGR